MEKQLLELELENKNLRRLLSIAVERLDDGSAWADESEEMEEMRKAVKQNE